MKRIRDPGLAPAFERVAAFSLRRAVAVVGAVAALALIGLLLASRLDPSASGSTLADRGTSASKATDELDRKFGGEPITVLVRGKLTGMLLTQDLGRLLGLEGCISGNAPPGAKPPAPVCAEFAKRKPIAVVYGPGTFINDAASRILDRLGLDQQKRADQARRAARAARHDARARGLGAAAQRRAAQRAVDAIQQGFARDALRLSLQFGLNSVPALNNPEFVLQLVFAPALGAELPKPRFSYVFPDKEAALIQARPRPGLSRSELDRTIAMVREATSSRAFKLKFGRYVVAGEPVSSADAGGDISSAARLVLLATLVVVAALLAIVFRAWRRLFALLPALAATGIAFGVHSLLGGSLSIALVAALPVLIGLGTSFGIQFQDRFERRRDELGRSRAAVEAARTAGPSVALAGLVLIAGLLALLLSSVPMVRSFGAVVAFGTLVAFVVTLTAGVALLGGEPPTLFRRVATGTVSRRGRAAGRWFQETGPAGRAAKPSPSRLRLASSARSFASKGQQRIMGAAVERPRRVLWIAVTLALLGLLAATQLDLVSDLERLAPSGNSAVKAQRTLRDATASSGQINVLVHGNDLADPRAIAWMSAYQRRVLARHGYSDRRPCREAQLCPGLSVTNLFGTGPAPDRRRVEAVYRSLPRYFARNVISSDRRTANMAFGVGRLSLDDQKKLVEDMRGQLDPPAGVSAELAGLPVIAAETHASLKTSRWTLGLVALVLVLGVLLVAYGTIERALVPLAPAALAFFWAAPLLWVLQIPLNPLSAALWALTIAVTAQFGVALVALDRKEDRRPLVATGAVTIAGFTLPIVSDFDMLRDFGLASFLDLAVALLGATIFVAAALVLAEEGVRLPRTRSEARVAARSLANRARVALAAIGRGARALPGQVRRAVPAARRRLRASALFRK
jgi:uncharacterized protein